MSPLHNTLIHKSWTQVIWYPVQAFKVLEIAKWTRTCESFVDSLLIIRPKPAIWGMGLLLVHKNRVCFRTLSTLETSLLEADHRFHHLMTWRIANKLPTSVAYTRQPSEELDNLFRLGVPVIIQKEAFEACIWTSARWLFFMPLRPVQRVNYDNLAKADPQAYEPRKNRSSLSILLATSINNDRITLMPSLDFDLR